MSWSSLLEITHGEEGAGLRDSAYDAPTSRGQAEEDWPVEETGQEGDEQVWVKPEGGALPGGRDSHVDPERPLPGVVQWVAAAGVTTFYASLSVNSCQTVEGSRVGNKKVEPGPWTALQFFMWMGAEAWGNSSMKGEACFGCCILRGSRAQKSSAWIQISALPLSTSGTSVFSHAKRGC